MEPVHYFEFNALLDWCILMTTRPLQQLEHHIGCQYGFYMFCIVNQIVQKWSNFCLFTDIILCQLDRFLALYWNAEYMERVDDNKSKLVILVTKLFMAIIILVCIFIDPESFSCTPDVQFSCHFFVKNALYYRSLPMLFVLLTIVTVSLYVLSVVIKHQRTVAPVINNMAVVPQPPVPTISAAVVEEDPTVEDIEEGEDEVVVKRNNSNPHHFIKVSKRKMGNITNHFSIPSSKEFWEKTKVIMKSSLMTLCLISTMIPQNLVVVYVFVRESTCLNDPLLITYGNISGFIALINTILYPLLVRRKLKNF